MLSSQTIFYKQAFTLIEVLVTVVIVGVMAGIGLPSFNQTIKNSRLATNANGLITSLNLARSEAIKRNVRVYIERKGDSSQNWDSGWNVFIEGDNNQTYDAGTDELLKTFPPLSNNYTLRTGANFADWVAFLPTGMSSSSGGFPNDSFRVCATADDLENSRRVAVNIVGRARVTTGDVISCP